MILRLVAAVVIDVAAVVDVVALENVAVSCPHFCKVILPVKVGGDCIWQAAEKNLKYRKNYDYPTIHWGHHLSGQKQVSKIIFLQKQNCTSLQNVLGRYSNFN